MSLPNCSRCGSQPCACKPRVLAVEEWQVKQRLAMPFASKVQWSRQRIREWYDHFDGKVYVAFSGGKDSQVLLHLVRSDYPDVPAVFYAEPTFPEVLAIVQQTPNCVTLRPKKKLPAIIERFGYPVISKEVARYVYEARSAGSDSATWRLRTTGVTSRDTYSKRSRLPRKWLKLLTAPFLVSDRCCNINKKNPAKAYAKRTGRYAIIGTLACESNQRMLAYKRFGCNGYDLSQPRSTPLGVWTPEDVATYSDAHGIKHAEVYDMGYTRTGCMVCGFGCHMRKPNQFELLRDTHPKVWRWGMETLGWQRVLDWLDIPCGEPPLFRSSTAAAAAAAAANRLRQGVFRFKEET